LGDGVLDAENHGGDDVNEVQPDEEWQKAPELERRRMAVVGKSVNADADADEYADNTRSRKQWEQVLVRVNAFADAEEDEGEPQLGKQQRRTQAQCVHDGVNDANLLVACV
jgi:hypothetical protein